jgi:hypothetical protein
MMTTTPRRRALGALALSLSLLTPARGSAQAVDPQRMSAAQTLYDQATAELDAKNYASACPKLQEVERLIPEGLGAKMTLAQCYEGWGKLASAWSEYTLVAELARRAGQAERAEQAAKKAAEIRPRLALMTIQVPAEARALPGLEIKRDGEALGEAQWGLEVPVDAGAHTIEATAPGRAPWNKTIEVAPKPGTITVAVPVLAPSPSSTASTVGGGWGAPRIAGVIVGGVGIAGIVVGSIFGAQAIAKQNASNADGHCDADDFCDTSGKVLRSEGRTAGNISTAGFIAGGALLAGGVILVLTAPARPGKPEAATVAIGLGSIHVQARW